MTDSNDLIHSFAGTADTEPNLSGLTKRELAAFMAMQGLMAVSDKGEQNWDLSSIQAAKIAVMCADALINELNKTIL